MQKNDEIARANVTLHEKCPYWEFFWSVCGKHFSRSVRDSTKPYLD